VPAELDHLLLGVNHLDHGIAWIEERSGVRAVFGGVHPGRGTCNALLALGSRCYLEIIAPDPQQAGSSAGRELWAARLNTLREPRLIQWAAHTGDLAALAKKALAAGIAIEDLREGSRTRPDGRVLRWKSFGLKDDRGGLLPFFIEWSPESIHPAQDAPTGCVLLQFSAQSPHTEQLAEDTGKLELSFQIERGPAAFLRARLRGNKGEFELTGQVQK
jgi:hypothetical protein